MLTDVEAAAFATALVEADRTKTPARQISQQRPDLTIDDAYAIQRAGVAIALAAGRVVGARKIGLTSKVMQDTVGITEPDHGVIYQDMFFGHGDTIPFDRCIAPRIEVELAFVLSADLTGPDCTLEQVLAATEYVCPAIEILDARIQMKDPDTGSTRTIVDTISDNAADAGIIIGSQRLDPNEVDLPWVCAVLRRNGRIEESGVAAAVLDHPALGVAWLANRLHRHGEILRAGELILAGSFTRILWVERGDDFVADYGSSSGPIGSIEFRFR